MPLLSAEGRILPDEPPAPALEDWRSAPGHAVALANDVDPVDLADALSGVSLIELAFPKYRDGRAYSQAARLRKALGWTGHLRATGDVLPDQVRLMRAVGFDSVRVEGEADAARVAEALSRPPPRSWRERLEGAAG